MTAVFAVGDAHGRLDLIVGLLAKADIWDPVKCERPADITTVHLGDLANCVAASVEADVDCLTAARDLFDVTLVGNHEHPYFGGQRFSGFSHNSEVEAAVGRLDWQPSFAAGDFLLTHAGLTVEMNTPHPDSIDEAPWDSAETADDELRWAWRTDPTFPLFNGIGQSRGGCQIPGILWADWADPKTTGGMSQIVGHTPGPIRVQGQLGHAKFTNGRPYGFQPDETFVMCIDVGAAKGNGPWPDGNTIAGCWIRANQVEVITYSSDGGA